MPARVTSGPAPTAYGRALRRLSRRDHSEGELRRALLRDGFAPEEVESTLERLRSRGLLDDAGFAARFARSRMAVQGVGRHRVRQALRQRAVGRSDTESGIAAALEEVSERDAIDRLARRYWRERAGDDPRRRLRGLWLRLVRRGFPAAEVMERLQALWPRWRDALSGIEPAASDEAEATERTEGEP